jgi:HEAT repeat protein
MTYEIEFWVQDLAHSDPAVRFEAAKRLGASGDRTAADALIGALPDSISKVKYAALSGLIKLGAANAVHPILDMLAANDSAQVWGLLNLNIGMRLRAGLLDLVERGDQDMADRLTELLRSSETLTDAQRALYVRMLGRTADVRAVESLLNTLENDTVTLQGAAAEALGFIGDARAIDSLMPFTGMQMSNDELREVAVEALGRIADPTVFDTLMIALNDESEWVRRAAAEGLGNMGNHDAVEALAEKLNDISPTVQDTAFEALKKLSYSRYTQ